MIQIIAVHSGGTMPRVMELETSRLDHVQAHALAHLPRAPSGVPELRALGKGDGEVSFKFKVAPDKLSQADVPELLTLWDAKFTEARLKLIAKQHKAERDAASAAGLWKEGNEKGDLNAMHDQATPAEATAFTQALATVVGKQRGTGKAKRLPKPKDLPSVIAATTKLDPLTGERQNKVDAVDSAVATIRVREIIKSMTSSADHAQEFADPLELARLKDGVQTPAVNAAVAETVPEPATTAIPDAKPSADRTQRAKTAIERHKSGKSRGPRLMEMGVQDLFKHLDKASAEPVPQKESASAAAPGPNSDSDGAEHAASSMPEGFEGFDDPAYLAHFESMPLEDATFERADLEHGTRQELDQDSRPAAGQVPCEVRIEGKGDPAVPVDADVGQLSTGERTESQLAVLDWTDLTSFRLPSQLNHAQALVLPTGEVYEALAHVTVQEPLVVRVEWLRDAAREADVVLPEAQRLEYLTEWMREQLEWRTKELQRWLGKGDLVSPDHLVAPRPTKKDGLRPPGWLNTAMDMASLAQQISMDIAMVDLCASEVDRSLSGMPAWAIDAMRQMREFQKQQAASQAIAQAADKAGDQAEKPARAIGAAFRDSWRAELLRIDGWCAGFKNIRIARQFGLFGSTGDNKLLIRLEALINRTKAWQAAPAQASRVLAVWLAFVLSLDHGAVAAGFKSQPTQPEVSHA